MRTDIWMARLVVIGVPVGLVAAIVVGAVAWINANGLERRGVGRLVVGACVFACFALLSVLWEGFRHRTPSLRSVPLPRAEHPALWALLDQTSQALGVPAPTETVLTGHSGMSLSEHGRLELGLPILAVLSVDELQALTAQELARYRGPDAGARSIVRFRDFVRSLALVKGASLGGATGVWERVLGWAVDPVERRLERGSALEATAVVSPDTLAAAIQHFDAAQIVWTRVIDDYASLFGPAECRASRAEATHEVFRAWGPTAEFQELQAHLDDTVAPGDERLPWSARTAVLQATFGNMELNVAPVSAPAWDLLGHGRGSLDEAETPLFGNEEPTTSWQEVIARGVAADCIAVAGTLTRVLAAEGVLADPTYGTALAFAEARPDHFVVACMGSGENVAASALRQEATDTACGVVDALARAAAQESGLATAQVSWVGPAPLVDAAGNSVSTVVPEFTPGQVRSVINMLIALGARLDIAPGALRPPPPRGVLATLTHVRREDGTWWHFVPAGGGLMLLPAPHSWSDRFMTKRVSREAQRVTTLAERGLPALQAEPGAVWIPRATIASIAGKGKTFIVRLRAGGTVSVRQTRLSKGSETFDEFGMEYADLFDE